LRIKEQQLDLFADRTSAAALRANQLWLWFASMAGSVGPRPLRIDLRDTQFATATYSTVPRKLLKIDVQLDRVSLPLSDQAYPDREPIGGRTRQSAGCPPGSNLAASAQGFGTLAICPYLVQWL
jgi:Transposase DDE domain group 1